MRLTSCGVWGIERSEVCPRSQEMWEPALEFRQIEHADPVSSPWSYSLLNHHTENPGMVAVTSLVLSTQYGVTYMSASSSAPNFPKVQTTFISISLEFNTVSATSRWLMKSCLTVCAFFHSTKILYITFCEYAGMERWIELGLCLSGVYDVTAEIQAKLMAIFHKWTEVGTHCRHSVGTQKAQSSPLWCCCCLVFHMHPVNLRLFFASLPKPTALPDWLQNTTVLGCVAHTRALSIPAPAFSHLSVYVYTQGLDGQGWGHSV